MEEKFAKWKGVDRKKIKWHPKCKYREISYKEGTIPELQNLSGENIYTEPLPYFVKKDLPRRLLK